jgi:superfamily I DNA and/or RNA helicase/very-short-patch-repair endonuclease
MDQTNATILSKLEASRKELLDLGLRNSLLNYKTPKGKGIHVVQEKSTAIFDLLVKQNKLMSFIGRPTNDETIGELAFLELSQPELESSYTDTKLQTNENDTKLQSRLLNTYYTANTNIEEQGVNILYLALGMLIWFDSENSSEEITAPLVLIPVQLERSSAAERFRLKYSGEEIGSNISLQEKMKEFDLKIPDLPEIDDFDIEQYFQKIELAIKRHAKWRVERNFIELGFFSFGKFLIYIDLDNNKWPQDKKPVDNALLQSLYNDGFQQGSLPYNDESFIDTDTSANELFQVVDADSSQILSVLAAREGKNLVIQGPPGTGKSQTITNIIADAVGQGKKVLFVAEKLAALEVVKRRLDNIGLGECCLELHSQKANKKEMHQELMRIIDLGKPKIQKLLEDVSLLGDYREELNAYCKDINTEIGHSRLSTHKLIGLLLKISHETDSVNIPKFQIDNFSNWNVEDMHRVEAFAEQIQARLKVIGVPNQLLFWGCKLQLLMPSEQEALNDHLKISYVSTEALNNSSNRIAQEIEIEPPLNYNESQLLLSLLELASRRPDLIGINIVSNLWVLRKNDIQEIISSGEALAALHEKYLEIFIPEVWEQNVLEIRQNLLAHGNKWYRFLISDYKKSTKQLASFCKIPPPKGNSLKIEYIDDILKAKRFENVLKEYQELILELFASVWKNLKTDWGKLMKANEYLFNVHQQIIDEKCPKEILTYIKSVTDTNFARNNHNELSKLLNNEKDNIEKLIKSLALDESLRFKEGNLISQPFNDLLLFLADWKSRCSELHHIISWNNLVERAIEEKLDFLTNVASHWDNAKDFLKNAIQKSWYEFLLQQAFTSFSSLRKFQRDSHEEIIQQFIKLDTLNLQYNRARVALKHWENFPNMQAGGQVGILRMEFNKRSRLKPIRKIIAEAGQAVQQIKPVFMMSPLSIANFLPAGSIEFDIVIFDEASQVRPVDAFGAILRAKQLIVVGDKKQLPPTNFFESLTKETDEEENETSDIESILGMCDSKGCLPKMLRWHYRSLHESLIRFSNNQFYENRLVIFPSPGSKYRMGFVFNYLKDTYYDRGKTRTNPKEAEIVVDAVIEHARRNPRLSLGVVAFSSAQRQCIQDALEIKRRKNPDVEGYFNSHRSEPFFIKNLENVQGDERDVIFISIGYGRSEDGYIAMSFGPLNNEGGEKRLNVLITRAKLRCEIFTNLTSDDIDLNRTQKYGIRVLKEFLYFAEHGKLNITEETGLPEDSYFEQSVADKLTQLGYLIHKQVGSQGFYLDMAIVDPQNPGRYILGIECDGAAYHSARSARDRDRLRQQVLENIGWNIYRIWSTDWFRHPEEELKRVVQAIEKAKDIILFDDSELEKERESYETQAAFMREKITEDVDGILMYKCAVVSSEISQYELHLYPVGKLAGWMEEVVKVESPVHFDEVARRMVEAAGASKVGSRIRDCLRQAMNHLKNSKRIKIKKEFLWLVDMEKPTIRNRINLSNSARKMKFIAPEEIALALEKVVQDSIAIQQSDAATWAAKMFGFNRVTEDMKEEIYIVLYEMMNQKVLRKEGELIKLHD